MARSARGQGLARNQVSVLDVLWGTGGTSYSGAAIAAALADVSASSVYAALHALEARGFVTGTWDVTGARPLRAYVVTAAGRAALTTARQTVRAYRLTPPAAPEEAP